MFQVHSIHAMGGKRKRQDVDQYKDGERGFLVTGFSCQDALRGLKDLRQWLEVEADDTGTSNVTNVEATPSTVGKNLDAELLELRQGDLSARRFLSTGMVCKRVAFLKLQHAQDVPSDLAHRFLGPGKRRTFTSRFAERILPVDNSSQPTQQAFESLVREVFNPHKGKTWRLVFEPFRGGWNTISQQDALSACKMVLGEDCLSVTSPEVTLLCTLCPRFVGLAALPMDFEDLQVQFE
mmetsp:Transcript_19996/g.38416  ORF Transcript_19996/g.38416 Transcript_19996/m.38416 type:complete len:237 (+) Transcript_19996:3-713(+)